MKMQKDTVQRGIDATCWRTCIAGTIVPSQSHFLLFLFLFYYLCQGQYYNVIIGSAIYIIRYSIYFGAHLQGILLYIYV